MNSCHTSPRCGFGQQQAVFPYIAYIETYNHARRQGLSHEDAHQIAQETREAHAGMHRVVGGFIWDAFGDTLADIVEIGRSIFDKDAFSFAVAGSAAIITGLSARGARKIL